MRLDFEQWQELASPFYEVHPREPKEDSRVDIEIDEFDGLFLAKLASPAEMLVHDPQTRKDACHDYLLFERFYAGGGRAEVADVGFDVTPSRLHLIDMSQRYVSMKDRCQSRGICIPHAALGYARGEEPVMTSVALDSPKGRLLAAAHAELVAVQADGTAEDAALIAQTFVGLVRQLMLGPEPGNAPVDDRDLPLTLLLQDFVATNLHRPDLDVDTLTSAFGISRATLYRHFENEGGVSRFIRNRRLDRCFFELAGAKAERGQVAATARRWHFTDATHFNRLFRARFSISPSACLSTGIRARSGAPSDQMGIVTRWLDRIRPV
ncbi:MAG: helix-turn-helix domain-containing protein [Alphaproteobacteria bacterium]|nr:helix-turn-helix domain-containing protein [Alphaproteobacteria bacterium]